MSVDTKQLRKFAEHALAAGGDWLAVFRGAANPQTVIALLDEIERLRAEHVRDTLMVAALRARLAKAGQQDAAVLAVRCGDESAALRTELDAIKIDRDEWRIQHDAAVECWREEVGRFSRQLAAMTAARDEACDIALRFETQLHDLEDECVCYAHPPLGMRIAELRKVGTP